ncbi:uncharacterized protein [Physcomitrium patens]|uniref:Cytochrome c oxidase assembly protein CtaG/Cox11 n=1 Tax=Physcomitrium patens TaxID=3218 RepID=A0A2K1J6Q0_PHYPA|nr:cytochrome c oxidase assembly protein COX11, mitochondrial-like [Physcomitrium patens]PNR37196.1 hypothetical protein PHYPA_020303 [Physcomitrium patens]|eukprot:XP_024398108.1 cytochrome c oxidase assembly protein COX11, mitochondrial-like [Physcomitrella patens]
MMNRWRCVKSLSEALHRHGLAAAASNSFTADLTLAKPLPNIYAKEASTSHSEKLVLPSVAVRTDVHSLCFLWSTLSRLSLNREYSTLLANHRFCSIPSRGGAEIYGFRTRGFSSQAEIAAKAGARRAKLTWESQTAGKKKSEAMLMYLVAMVTAMVGITYAAVPLYRKFCQATGYGGTVQRKETVEEKIARHKGEEAESSRELVVQFNADVADGMPWKFTPCQREIRVRPGQSTLAFYTAENTSSVPITGVSTYNVTPMKAGLYFNKIQCFCFEEQRLLPGEKIDMPVFFFIDPEFATDPKMKGINSLILSYTFFKVEEAPQKETVASPQPA